MEGLALSALFGLAVLILIDGLSGRKYSGGITSAFLGMKRLGFPAASAALVGFLAFTLTQWPVAGLIGAGIGAAVPRIISSERRSRTKILRMDAWADSAAGLADKIRTGLGIEDALSRSAESAPEVITKDLMQLSRGIGWREKPARDFDDDPIAEQLWITLHFASRSGGRNTSEILDAISEDAAEMAATLREARARQTNIRLAARVILGALVFLLAVNHSYFGPFGTGGGQIALAVGCSLIGAGYLLMLRFGRVEAEL
jgi:Flp pilus assembly protein TadB